MHKLIFNKSCLLEFNDLCNEWAFKLQFEIYNVGQYADKMMFKIAYLIGNFNFTYLRICIIYAGYAYFFLHVHSYAIRDLSFEDNEKRHFKISFYISMLQKNFNI